MANVILKSDQDEADVILLNYIKEYLRLTYVGHLLSKVNTDTVHSRNDICSFLTHYERSPKTKCWYTGIILSARLAVSNAIAFLYHL